MEYLLYFGIGFSVLYFAIKRLSLKGEELVNVFWDGYRIYATTGDQEARAALLIGLATLGKLHRDTLISAIGKDNQESALMLNISQQFLDDETSAKMQSIYPNIDPISALNESAQAELKNVQRDVREILAEFSKIEPDLKLSMALKSKYSKDFPELVSAINRFKCHYFREKYPTMNEPAFHERLKIWAMVEKQSNQ